MTGAIHEASHAHHHCAQQGFLWQQCHDQEQAQSIGHKCQLFKCQCGHDNVHKRVAVYKQAWGLLQLDTLDRSVANQLVATETQTIRIRKRH